MPKHYPIKFEATAEPTIKKFLTRAIKENKTAKSALNAAFAIIALGGILTIGFAAPGALALAGKIMREQKRKHREEYNKIWRNFNNLRRRGALEFIKDEKGYQVYRLSEKGKEKIKKIILDEMAIPKQKSWDKKWRLVIFDIPESYSKARRALREKLKELEFYQCQKSAWIHPFPCLEEIEFIKSTLNINPFVKLFVVDEMTDGKTLYNFRQLIKSSV